MTGRAKSVAPARSPVHLATPLTAPRIGDPWPGHGGAFAGVMFLNALSADYCLVVADADQASLSWKKANDWAEKLTVDGHADFKLPTRAELRVLYGNVAHLFAKDWYWSGEQYASYPDYAWYQVFDGGNQDGDRKDDKFRARAVRRIPFSNLVIHPFA